MYHYAIYSFCYGLSATVLLSVLGLLITKALRQAQHIIVQEIR
jgi:hypothetical protein